MELILSFLLLFQFGSIESQRCYRDRNDFMTVVLSHDRTGMIKWHQHSLGSQVDFIMKGTLIESDSMVLIDVKYEGPTLETLESTSKKTEISFYKKGRNILYTDKKEDATKLKRCRCK